MARVKVTNMWFEDADITNYGDIVQNWIIIRTTVVYIVFLDYNDTSSGEMTFRTDPPTTRADAERRVSETLAKLAGRVT